MINYYGCHASLKVDQYLRSNVLGGVCVVPEPAILRATVVFPLWRGPSRPTAGWHCKSPSMMGRCRRLIILVIVKLCGGIARINLYFGSSAASRPSAIQTAGASRMCAAAAIPPFLRQCFTQSHMSSAIRGSPARSEPRFISSGMSGRTAPLLRPGASACRDALGASCVFDPDFAAK